MICINNETEVERNQRRERARIRARERMLKKERKINIPAIKIFAFCTFFALIGSIYFGYTQRNRAILLSDQLNTNLSAYTQSLIENEKLEEELDYLKATQAMQELTKPNEQVAIAENNSTKYYLDETEKKLSWFLYEDLRVEPVEFVDVSTKTVYLTFDDGPSPVTTTILDILDQYEIKATFFVQGSALNWNENIEILKRIHEEGHAIGAHTDTHVYNEVYASATSFLRDFYAVWDKIYQITGEKTPLYRFPGGSINAYNKHVIEEIVEILDDRGFVYYDWNVSSEDSIGANTTVSNIIYNATLSRNYNKAIVLMHDASSKVNTATALPEIIEHYKNQGYTFAVLTPEISPIQF